MTNNFLSIFPQNLCTIIIDHTLLSCTLNYKCCWCKTIISHSVNESLPHLPWRPVNLQMSLQRQFHFPPALFTCLMKNWGVPEIIAGELLHSGQNSRGICKSIKNDIFWLENNFYLHYSHKGVIVTVTETISKLQNWHTCKNFRGTLPCNLSKCAVFHT